MTDSLTDNFKSRDASASKNVLFLANNKLPRAVAGLQYN